MNMIVWLYECYNELRRKNKLYIIFVYYYKVEKGCVYQTNQNRKALFLYDENPPKSCFNSLNWREIVVKRG